MEDLNFRAPRISRGLVALMFLLAMAGGPYTSSAAPAKTRHLSGKIAHGAADRPDPPTLSGAPRGVTRSRSATIEITGPYSVTFECMLDSGAYKACESPHVLTGLRNGSHTLWVHSVDPVTGNSSPASASWIVDPQTPVAPRFGRTTSRIVGLGRLVAQFNFAGQAHRAFQCKRDDGRWARCHSPLKLNAQGVGRGTHVIAVRQLSPSGTPGPQRKHTYVVTPPLGVDYWEKADGELRIGLVKPTGCNLGRFQFDLWGSNAGQIHIKGNNRCAYSSSRLNTHKGVEGRITAGGITLTIKGQHPYSVVQNMKWRIKFAGQVLRSGSVKFIRAFHRGVPDKRIYWDTGDSRYWDDACYGVTNDWADNARAYCWWPGYPSTWQTRVE